MNQAYRILPLRKMTKPTLGYFSELPIFSIDRTQYHPPRLENSTDRPWNMNPRETTKILPLNGYQNVELFYPSQQLHFHVKLNPYTCVENGELCCDEPYLFEINHGVFYRSYTGNEEATMQFPSQYQMKRGESISHKTFADHNMEAYPKDYLLYAYR